MDFSRDVAAIRLDNALLLFDEFVRSTVKHADAATLRGLERRFAERLQIQPSYWSQIKGRSRQIGERLARQFEQCCQKPYGWMDQPQGGGRAALGAASPEAPSDSPLPQDDDERFIVGLVLTYYRRHPQRARTRLLDLLGEVLMPGTAAGPAMQPPQAAPPAPRTPPAPLAPGVFRPPKPSPAAPAPDDMHALWLKSQSGVAPLKKR
ncbi:hypothetical protein AACH06_14615 [Ideonella sp. DXS29W]|uniref:DUF1631 family protein n=1 Tax=Ideonella lacteola TaxID=2984193 RepID=A0ABU9BQJ7_9BURK